MVFAVKPVGRGENPETVASHASEDVRAVQSEERAQGMTQDTNGGRRGSEKRRGQPRILFSDEAAPQELPAAIRKTERGGPEVVEDVLQGTLATVAVIEENTKGKIQPESTAALRRSVGSTPAPTLLERKGSGRFHGIGEAGGADGRQLVKVAARWGHLSIGMFRISATSSSSHGIIEISSRRRERRGSHSDKSSSLRGPKDFFSR